MKKPIDAKRHGIIDYAFTGVQLLGPSLLGINGNVRKTYQALGTGFAAVNAFTDTPVGLKPVISFKGHQKADISYLLGLSLLTASSMIRKNRRALAFHLGFFAAALAHYVLTNYNSRN
ncbi:hypothetical protein SAMN05421747_10967 [Parapedobacter composti]|uniref:Uncharacterized protein n=1 Tax=Parapedobacter composti TaxID=623281 RepID=A0A1I1II19_9SPHI|nr:hypothetical protein [Parapedobacter composti]SFC35601.1 hypothetical protein SAMN05421747_10967 [Parapedobacter composti]